MVEGDRADIVVEHMSLDDTVKKGAADETKFPINGRCGTARVGPSCRGIVRKGGVGVLKEGDGN